MTTCEAINKSDNVKCNNIATELLGISLLERGFGRTFHLCLYHAMEFKKLFENPFAIQIDPDQTYEEWKSEKDEPFNYKKVK